MSNYNDEQEIPKIGMLLDVGQLYGEHEGRLGPWMCALAMGAAPILLFVYFNLFQIIPLWIAIPVFIFIAIRAVMIFPGREGYRVELFKKQILSDYMSTADLLNIKTIHPDGCIEYLNGKIQYLVVCFNRTTEDTVRRSVQIKKLLLTMMNDCEFDIYIHNINDSPALRNYYKKVSNFNKNEAAKNFVQMIDHMITLTENTSNVQCTIFAIKGSRSDWKNIRTSIDTACSSKVARCYKSISRVNDPDVINEVLNRDVDSVINISELLRHKYATKDYATSKVIAYDLPEDQEIIQGKAAVNPVIKSTKSTGFHTKYKGD